MRTTKRSCTAFAIDKYLNLKDLLSFALLLISIIYVLCRNHFVDSDIVSLQHPLCLHSTTENKRFVQAVDFIARCRGQPANAVYNPLFCTSLFDSAIIYVAIHQLLRHHEVPLLLGSKHDNINCLIQRFLNAQRCLIVFHLQMLCIPDSIKIYATNQEIYQNR
jgi:hypothetical protein